MSFLVAVADYGAFSITLGVFGVQRPPDNSHTTEHFQRCRATDDRLAASTGQSNNEDLGTALAWESHRYQMAISGDHDFTRYSARPRCGSLHLLASKIHKLQSEESGV